MIYKKYSLVKIVSLCSVLSMSLFGSGVVDLKEIQWQDNKESKEIRKDWQESNRYCEELVLEGHDDWRLPTIKELQSLVDLNKYRPAIKDNIKNISVLTFYWSSTQVADDPKSAWHIFYKYGESYYGSKTEKYGVRCIRDK